MDNKKDLLISYEKKINLYNNTGYVELVDMMPRIVDSDRYAGIAVANNARISYNQTNKSIEADKKLLAFLLKHKHMSPFESVIFKFKVRMPLYTVAQWERHRTFSYNESSARYIDMSNDFYFPELRMQSKNNKQGSSDEKVTEKAMYIWESSKLLIDELYKKYKDLLDEGVSRELARSILPSNVMKEVIVTGNLRNWLHFLHLRMGEDSQQEIREAANAIFYLIKLRTPNICENWEDNIFNSITLSSKEIDIIANKKEIEDNI